MPIQKRLFRNIKGCYEYELIEEKLILHKTRKKKPKSIMKELFFELTNQRYQNDNFEIVYSGKYNSITTYEEHSNETYMTIYTITQDWKGLHQDENT